MAAFVLSQETGSAMCNILLYNHHEVINLAYRIESRNSKYPQWIDGSLYQQLTNVESNLLHGRHGAVIHRFAQQQTVKNKFVSCIFQNRNSFSYINNAKQR